MKALTAKDVLDSKNFNQSIRFIPFDDQAAIYGQIRARLAILTPIGSYDLRLR